MSNFGMVDYMLEISRGNVPGVSCINKFGHNDNVIASFTPVWALGAALVQPPNTGLFINLRSSVATDIATTGTGARTTYVQGLNTSFNEVEYTAVSNNGTSNASVGTLTRIQRAYVETAGSSGFNDGQLEFQNAGTQYSSIEIGYGQTLQAMYTVPNAKTAYMTNLKITTSGTKAMVVELRGQYGINTATPVWRVQEEIHMDAGSSVNINYRPYKVFPAMTDIIVFAKVASLPASEVSASFDLILVDD